MLRQSLWITRQPTCDTLLNPERGQMTGRRLVFRSRLIFLLEKGRCVHHSGLVSVLVQICQAGFFAKVSSKIAPERIQQETGIHQR